MCYSQYDSYSLCVMEYCDCVKVLCYDTFKPTRPHFIYDSWTTSVIFLNIHECTYAYVYIHVFYKVYVHNIHVCVKRVSLDVLWCQCAHISIFLLMYTDIYHFKYCMVIIIKYMHVLQPVWQLFIVCDGILWLCQSLVLWYKQTNKTTVKQTVVIQQLASAI